MSAPIPPSRTAGMGTSLRAGLDNLSSTPGVTRAVITLVDLPWMTASIVRRILDEPAGLDIATYGGERGHPVKLDRRHWADAAAAASGDEGARRFLRDRPDVVELAIEDEAAGIDVDFAQ